MSFVHHFADVRRAPVFAAMVAAMAAVPPAGLVSAQQGERFTLDGNQVAVYNVAGAVRVEAGTGNAVVVEVTRGGADASRLRMEQRTVRGRTALCIVYPDERILYRPQNGSRYGSSTSTSSGDPCREDSGPGGWFGGRRIEVSTRGDGVEAWADIRILVPTGRDVAVRNLVGTVNVDGVEATLSVDVGSARVTTHATRGALSLDTGSGSVTVDGHRGDLAVDVGSGSIDATNVNGSAVNLETGSGSVDGSNITADELLIDTGSGGVTVAGVSLRRLRIDTGSGTVRAALTSSAEDIDIDTGSGGVTLTLPSNFGAALDISTGSGGIDSDFPVQSSRSNRNSLRGTVGDGRGRVTVGTGSGGVHLRRTGG
jgi:hypothetical protein